MAIKYTCKSFQVKRSAAQESYRVPLSSKLFQIVVVKELNFWVHPGPVYPRLELGWIEKK
jgi:hypothetical protein